MRYFTFRFCASLIVGWICVTNFALGQLQRAPRPQRGNGRLLNQNLQNRLYANGP